MEPIVTPVEQPTNSFLYSSRAVRGFSMLFSAIVGGILIAQNLKDIGEPAASRKALWGSISYTALLMFALSYLPDNFGGSFLPIAVGLVGSIGLEAFFKKYISNWEEIPTKSIVKPLLICLAIFIPLITLLIYAMVNAPAE